MRHLINSSMSVKSIGPVWCLALAASLWAPCAAADAGRSQNHNSSSAVAEMERARARAQENYQRRTQITAGQPDSATHAPTIATPGFDTEICENRGTRVPCQGAIRTQPFRAQ